MIQVYKLKKYILISPTNIYFYYTYYKINKNNFLLLEINFFDQFDIHTKSSRLANYI